MDNTINIHQLKDHMKPLVMFGEVLIEVKQNSDGYKIEILELEEGQLVNLNNEVVEDNHSSTTCVSVLFTDEKGEINFIEHPFGAFTKSNKDIVPILLELVGETIDISGIQLKQK